MPLWHADNCDDADDDEDDNDGNDVHPPEGRQGGDGEGSVFCLHGAATSYHRPHLRTKLDIFAAGGDGCDKRLPWPCNNLAPVCLSSKIDKDFIKINLSGFELTKPE